jgi:hypothetical protein
MVRPTTDVSRRVRSFPAKIKKYGVRVHLRPLHSQCHLNRDRRTRVLFPSPHVPPHFKLSVGSTRRSSRPWTELPWRLRGRVYVERSGYTLPGLATATSRCSLGVDSNLEAVRVTPLRSDVLPSEELAGNAAPIVGAYAVIP